MSSLELIKSEIKDMLIDLNFELHTETDAEERLKIEKTIDLLSKV